MARRGNFFRADPRVLERGDEPFAPFPDRAHGAAALLREPPPILEEPVVAADRLEAEVRDTVHREAVLGHPVHALSIDSAADLIIRRALIPHPGAWVHCTNVDLVVKSHRITDVRRAAEDALLSVADGMPLVWILRRRGLTTDRVAGTELMCRVAELGAVEGLRHLMFGGTEGVAATAAAKLEALSGNRVDLYVPPWSPDGDWDLTLLRHRIAETRPHVMWVCLGAPKQELWMARIAAELGVPVLVGVGAAFDFLAGAKRRAPRVFQQAGLEWLFRLATEPRRLWRRYLLGNSEFILRLAAGSFSRSRSRV